MSITITAMAILEWFLWFPGNCQFLWQPMTAIGITSSVHREIVGQVCW